MALVRLPQGWTPSDLEGAVKDGDSIQTCKGTFKCQVRPRSVPLVAIADTETIHVNQAWYILQDTITVAPKRVHTMQMCETKQIVNLEDHKSPMIVSDPVPHMIRSSYRSKAPLSLNQLMQATNRTKSELMPYLERMCEKTKGGYILKTHKKT
jgi:hypothetical protein